MRYEFLLYSYLNIFNNNNNLTPTTMRVYFFKSSNKCDKLSQLTIASTTMLRAYALAVMNFKSNGYKGTPIRL